MLVEHSFYQEVYLDGGNDSAEVEVTLNCDCEQIRAQSDVGIFSNYLEVSNITISTVYLDGEETHDSEILKQVEEEVKNDFDRISTIINEGV